MIKTGASQFGNWTQKPALPPALIYSGGRRGTATRRLASSAIWHHP